MTRTPRINPSSSLVHESIVVTNPLDSLAR